MGYDIKKSKDLDLFLQENIQSNENFHDDIEKIEEYELFDEFIDIIIYSTLDTSCLNEVLQAWCLHAINELHQSFIVALDSEKTKEQKEMQERLMKESEDKIKELKEMIDRNQEERRRKEEEYLEEIRKQNAAHQENMNQFKELQKQLLQSQAERDKTINQLMKELKRNRKPIVIQSSGSSGGRCNIC